MATIIFVSTTTTTTNKRKRTGFQDTPNSLSVYLTRQQREWVEKEAFAQRLPMTMIVSDLIEKARFKRDDR